LIKRLRFAGFVETLLLIEVSGILLFSIGLNCYWMNLIIKQAIRAIKRLNPSLNDDTQTKTQNPLLFKENHLEYEGEESIPLLDYCYSSSGED
jgi:hypothetical protein